MCGVQHATTNSGTWREFGWKNLMRYFITPKIKSKQGDNQGTCWRYCGTNEAHHSHVFWECGMLQPYWAAIHENISKILGYGIPKEFDVMYLGNLAEHIGDEDIYLARILMVAAKKAITRLWLQATPPTERQWVGIIGEIKVMEKMTYKLRVKEGLFEKRWEKWINYEQEGGTNEMG